MSARLHRDAASTYPMEGAVDDAIEAWHASDAPMWLHEFLGWTLAEYVAWAEGRWRPIVAPTRPVVFLDVDGVLNHHGLYEARKVSGQPWPLASDWIDRACVARLDRLCATMGARVVISSSWRVYAVIPGASVGLWRGAAEVLRACGLTAPVVGATRDHRTPEMIAAQQHAPRWPEIAEWLADHAHRGSWVVIDDMEMPGVPPARFVRTDIAVGLTDADVERAAAILGDNTQAPARAERTER